MWPSVRHLVNMRSADCTLCTSPRARFGDRDPWRRPPERVPSCHDEAAAPRRGRRLSRNPPRGTLMATESAAASGSPASSGVMDKGLKKGAIGYVSNIVIGVASTAPAYSLAATLGFIVVIRGVGVHAPAVLIASFVPILLVAIGYRYLNRADPDAGTTFAWTTRAFGPWFGWINGWAIFVADVIVMASLAVIASQYTFLLFDWNSAASSTVGIDRKS